MDKTSGGDILPVPSSVAYEAVEWMLELQERGADGTTRELWQRWLRADPLHEHAWQRIDKLNQRFAAVADTRSIDIARSSLNAGGALRRRQLVRMLVIATVGGGASWTAYRQAPWRETLADARTGVGEQRTLTLDDGSQVMLNTNTALDVQYNASVRRLRLLRGEVLIDSGKDPRGRPLQVDTDAGRVSALGTRFMVRAMASSRMQVTVLDGAVRLAPRDSSGNGALLLRAGQQSSFDSRSIAPPQPVDEGAAGWAQGMLVAHEMRLEDFVNELSRYSRLPLSCDLTLRELRISGTYRLDDVERALGTVAALLSLEVHTVTRFWGLQMVRLQLAPAIRKPRQAAAVRSL